MYLYNYKEHLMNQIELSHKYHNLTEEDINNYSIDQLKTFYIELTSIMKEYYYNLYKDVIQKKLYTISIIIIVIGINIFLYYIHILNHFNH